MKRAANSDSDSDEQNLSRKKKIASSGKLDFGRGKCPPTSLLSAGYLLVNTVKSVQSCIDSIEDVLASDRAAPLAVDFEGVHLSRDGEICVMQLFIGHRTPVFLIDVCTLQRRSFETKSSATKRSIRDLLEDTAIMKVMCDPRNDSDALYHQFGITLCRVFDVQLADVVIRRAKGLHVKYVIGLKKLIAEYAPLSFSEKDQLERLKTAGNAMFSPESGGSYAVFKERPLHTNLLSYCAADVMCLPAMYQIMSVKIGFSRFEAVMREGRKRIKVFELDTDDSSWRNKTIAPNF